MNPTPPRLVVTGAAGFLGRRLITLLGKSWRIIDDLDRPPTPSSDGQNGGEP